MLDKFTIVEAILGGKMDLHVDLYQINGVFYDWLYFLEDSIYPNWVIFINTYKHADNDMEQTFAWKQEGVHKDVECAFGVLVQ